MNNANFEYHVPTHIYFGDNQIQKLGAELAKHGSRVLLIYGSERLKSTPLYASILEQVKSAGLTLFEMGGVEPNPRHTTVDRAAGICRDKNIDVLLAVGGGSVTDCAKLTSPTVFHNGTCWDFLSGRAQMKKFLPIVTISTISGTGTDMDCLGIVNNIETREKTFFGNPALYPAASFLDPTETFTVSPYQTACGAIDAFIHYLEVYFMRPNLYRMRRKTPPFRVGDIRRVRRICVSN